MLGLRGLHRSTTMNSTVTDTSADVTGNPYDADHLEPRMHQMGKSGVGAHDRPSGRKSDGFQGATRRASYTKSTPAFEAHSASGGGVPSEHDASFPREDVTAPQEEQAGRDEFVRKLTASTIQAPDWPLAAKGTSTQHAVTPIEPQVAPHPKVLSSEAKADTSWNDDSVDLLAHPVHVSGMAMIPEVTEPLTGQWTDNFNKPSSSGAIIRAPSSEGLSFFGPPSNNAMNATATAMNATAMFQPGQQPATNLPAVFREGGMPSLELPLRTSSSDPRGSSGPNSGSGGPQGDRQGNTL
jgi:hypothetical protein